MTALNVFVAQSVDDAEEFSGTGLCVTGDGDLDFYGGIDEWIGCRFQNITIPAGSTIDTCIIRFTSAQDRSGTTPYLQDIACEDIDDAPVFVDAQANNIANRTRTTAKVIDWQPAGVVLDATFDTADFKASLQEVIDRGGWASGQDVVVIFVGAGAGDNRCEGWAFDHGSNFPQLRVTYTAAGGGVPPKMMHYAKMRNG